MFNYLRVKKRRKEREGGGAAVVNTAVIRSPVAGCNPKTHGAGPVVLGCIVLVPFITRVL